MSKRRKGIFPSLPAGASRRKITFQVVLPIVAPPAPRCNGAPGGSSGGRRSQGSGHPPGLLGPHLVYVSRRPMVAQGAVSHFRRWTIKASSTAWPAISRAFHIQDQE